MDPAVLMGDAKLAEVLRQGLVVVEGERELVRQFEMLFEFEESKPFAGQMRREAGGRDRAARGGRKGARVNGIRAAAGAHGYGATKVSLPRCGASSRKSARFLVTTVKPRSLEDAAIRAS